MKNSPPARVSIPGSSSTRATQPVAIAPTNSPGGTNGSSRSDAGLAVGTVVEEVARVGVVPAASSPAPARVDPGESPRRARGRRRDGAPGPTAPPSLVERGHGLGVAAGVGVELSGPDQVRPPDLVVGRRRRDAEEVVERRRHGSVVDVVGRRPSRGRRRRRRGRHRRGGGDRGSMQSKLPLRTSGTDVGVTRTVTLTCTTPDRPADEGHHRHPAAVGEHRPRRRHPLPPAG